MLETLAAGLILALSLTAGQSGGAPGTNNSVTGPAAGQEPNSVQMVLDRLKAEAANLKSYECKVDYIFRQPVFDSAERRKGTLQYARIEDHSYLYIDFTSLQYDQEKEQKHREQYLFDGVWLTFIDHENRNVQRQQIAEPNAPVDAFALVSQRVPIMGFSKIDDLEKQFEIELITPQAPADSSVYQLHMKVKPDSIYKDEYTSMDVQVDKKKALPVKIVAVTTEQDVYEIKLSDPKINENIPKATFEISYPKDYSVETTPLKERRQPQRQP
jgi:outer membrane lipoprotein-sorting protein